MNVRLHIDRVVLHGVDVRDRAQLQAEIESELARRIAIGGVSPQLENVPSVRAPEIALGTNLGTSIAGAVHEAIGARRS